MGNKIIIAQRAHKTIYREDNSCVKLFDESFSKSDVLNEALNQARIEETSLDIPKIKEVKLIDGKWAIVSDFIEGKTLQQIFDEDPNKKYEYLDFFVDLQLKVNQQVCPLLNKLRDKMHSKIDKTKFDATTKYDLHTRLDGMPKHNKVCHGDFNPSNIIISEQGKPYIIDWSHATQGNASADVARTYLLFCLEGDEHFAKKYLETFCKKSNTAKQYVEKWLPIVAASQSVKGNEHEIEFLTSWVDVVDYE